MKQRPPDIGFIPTPEAAIAAFLELAEVNSQDILYDLGCGDGRILIRAAELFGTHGVGIDIDPQRSRSGREKAIAAGVSDRVEFREQDLFECDFSDATVVFIYLLPHLNLKLLPRLLNQLQPGARLVSLDFDFGDWQPQKTISLPIPEESTLYYWKI
ncbi:methyltransferase domain-containing protein [Oscillatoria sp. FACHB-1406]|uniref:methyltransferase domain-containing protein n=1 Tax=Oscillatoria sp. FACHB-1406 TaxID=2692846 RepID=UPI0016862B95|nr:class I SAM-dependent methyltransferase [Oscillatoria sp. FACHB-1406]